MVFKGTCHINHKNSLAGFWIPLLVFAGLTVIIQFATFGYCIKVYLASLADDSTTTQSSGLPSYSNSIKTMTPRMAYRRVRRVITADLARAQPWLLCLVSAQGKKNQCLPLAAPLVVNEATVMAVLILLSVCTPMEVSGTLG
jgi:hypothetical protein